MKHIVIEYHQVQSIGKNGLTYHDEDGQEQFIDFEQCYQNYLKPRLTQEAYERFRELNTASDWNYEQYAECMRSFKEVGWHNAFGDSWVYRETRIKGIRPWFIFHTEPPVLLYFPDEATYHKIRIKFVRDTMWRTWDSG